MIFQHTLPQVLSGQKTQTRRVVKQGDEAVQEGERIIAVRKGGRTQWEVGKEYAVQPHRNAKAVARIKMLAIRREVARDISAEDVIKEGFDTREAFAETFARINNDPELKSEVWVLDFELVTA
jgi:hypothetical protein